MVGKVIETTKDSPLKQQLVDATSAMDNRFEAALTVYPQAKAELAARKETAIRQLKEHQVKLAAMKADFAAASAAKPKIPKGGLKLPELAPVDPQLGPKLREELLSRFGKPDPVDVNPALREVWEDWDWESWDKN